MEINMTAIGASIRNKQSAADAIQQANEILGLSFSEVAEALGVHRRTVFRYRKLESVPSAKVQERLANIREISSLLDEAFINIAAQQEWLHSPVPMLGNCRPIDLIRNGVGFTPALLYKAAYYNKGYL
jgi:putative toxin-antitoxin system antitoxin component (TIGR02293 family)